MKNLRYILRLVLSALVGGLIATAIGASAHGGNTQQIHSCVLLGQVRIIEANQSCSRFEKALDWNIKGFEVRWVLRVFKAFKVKPVLLGLLAPLDPSVHLPPSIRLIVSRSGYVRKIRFAVIPLAAQPVR